MQGSTLRQLTMICAALFAVFFSCSDSTTNLSLPDELVINLKDSGGKAVDGNIYFTKFVRSPTDTIVFTGVLRGDRDTAIDLRPNPLNVETTIAFSVLSADSVSVEILNYTKSKAFVFMQKSLFAPSTYEYSFDLRNGSGLDSILINHSGIMYNGQTSTNGLYWIRVNIGSKSYERKLLIDDSYRPHYRTTNGTLTIPYSQLPIGEELKFVDVVGNYGGNRLILGDTLYIENRNLAPRPTKSIYIGDKKRHVIDWIVD
jgi:hypothetical protein